jgi:CspA family cold shock protein
MMPTGTVKWFSLHKGYGLIAPSDGSRGVFVHVWALERARLRLLQEGETVSYDLVTDRRTGRMAAENLRLGFA